MRLTLVLCMLWSVTASYNTTMTSTSYDTSTKTLNAGTNTIGAIIFFAYIVAALAFSSVIVRDILVLSSQHDSRARRNDGSRGLGARLVGICSTAALISFSVLSWNMLSFLLVAYAHWAREHNIVTSRSLMSLSGLRVQIWYVWVWATSSTLFETFAEDLLRDSKTWRWTTLSLLYHYACNMYISTTGKPALLYHIPERLLY